MPEIKKISKLFAANLRRHRGEKTQEEFARFLGIRNQVTYHRYEKGRIPRPEILTRIAMKLNTTPDVLLGIRRLALGTVFMPGDDPAKLSNAELSDALSEMVSGFFGNLPATQTALFPHIEKFWNEFKARHDQRVAKGRAIRAKQAQSESHRRS